MRTSSLRLLAMGLTLAGVSILSACGGDAPAPTAAPTTPAPTTSAPTTTPAPTTPAPAAPAAAAADMDPKALMTSLGCVACHKTDAKLVGPSYQEVAKKYATQKDAQTYLAGKIMEGGSGVWGAVPMTPNKANPLVTKEKVDIMVDWILKGAK